MESTEKISFDAMPAIVSRLCSEIKELSALIKELTPSRQSVWMNVDDVHQYLPGHPAPRTIYGWARKDLIPHYRHRDRGLYFNREELDRWLAQQGGER